ncbi:MAG TPA: hypothetical protein VMX97_04575 [Hyphomicrobiaceae bacterium]|nr:hypothetical protein [Hyphomicrobiaceae bacterium]
MRLTVAVVRPSPTMAARLANPVADAFTRCFAKRGWKVEQHSTRIEGEPDLVAGYGWRDVMADAWSRWPDRVLHVDGAFWSRSREVKLGMGGRWAPYSGREFDGRRLAAHRVKIAPSRPPGLRVLVCGMSAKAAISWGLDPEQWERDAVATLVGAGADVTYRPKPRWSEARAIDGAGFEDGSRHAINDSLARVDAVATHHSNVAVDAIAAGLPIYTEIGLAKAMSVCGIETLPGSSAHDHAERERFLHEVAWHQWTLEELAAGVWMKAPAPLSGNLAFTHSSKEIP